MRLLKSIFVVAALALAGPVWAHGGHGHKHKHKHERHYDDWRDHRHYGHGAHGHYRHHVRKHHNRHAYYDSGYYAPYPAYGYGVPAPVVAAPGVHIVVPNIYIPLR